MAWVLLGSNIGHRGRALACLRESLQTGGVVVEAASAEVLTRPVGVAAQGDFHNQVVRLRAPEPWPPEKWLEHCRTAERDCGRRQTYRWGPRAADADILLLGERGELRVDTDALTVPHPELQRRPFALRLLRDAGAQIGSLSAS